MTLRTSVCQHCRKPLTFVQYHAGFSDQGFLYCGKDGTVLTWSSYDRHYTAVAIFNGYRMSFFRWFDHRKVPFVC